MLNLRSGCVIDALNLTSANFFFSSRRRHTRCGRDWSSDVCSSDLGIIFMADSPDALNRTEKLLSEILEADRTIRMVDKIGRASCRERVEISVVAVSLKKKKDTISKGTLFNEINRCITLVFAGPCIT